MRMKISQRTFFFSTSSVFCVFFYVGLQFHIISCFLLLLTPCSLYWGFSSSALRALINFLSVLRISWCSQLVTAVILQGWWGGGHIFKQGLALRL